jgi:hypothetical protein
VASGLALASVTAVVKRLIENGLARRAVTSLIGGDATISSLPPDRVPSGSDEKPQLNVFLFSVSPHSALSGKRNGSGPPPLALDLHYLISGYGAQDFQAEILLGLAIQILHEKPVVERDELRAILSSLSSTADRRVVPPTSAALAGSDLAERTARLTITPEFLSTEDSSKLWSAMQAKYRPSVTYKVMSIPVTAERMA